MPTIVTPRGRLLRPAVAVQAGWRFSLARGFSTFERAFDYGACGRGKDATLISAGRSRRRYSSAPSCLASTWPRSARSPSTSSLTYGQTAPRSGVSCSLSDNSAPRRSVGAAAATSTVDARQPPTHNRSKEAACWQGQRRPVQGVCVLNGPSRPAHSAAHERIVTGRVPSKASFYPLQSFAVVGECCGLRNRPQSAPTRSAMASAEEPAGLRTAKFRRYTLSFDNVL